MKKVYQDILMRVANQIAEKAKQKSPWKTGNLNRDIQVFDDNIDKGEVSVGNSKLASYAKFVHGGTVRQKSQPYLKKAVDEYMRGGGVEAAINSHKDELAEDIKQQIIKQLKNTKNIKIT